MIRALFFAFALAVLWNTLRRAELGRAFALAGAVGPWIAVALLPYSAIVLVHTETYRRILAILGRRLPFTRLLTLVLSAEAVAMSFPGGIAIADTISPYLLRQRCGVPVPDGLAAVTARKSLIVLSNALYVGLALALGAGYLRAASPRLIGVGGLEWLIAGSAVFMLVSSLGLSTVLVSGSVGARAHGLLSRVPSARLRGWLEARKTGFLETDRHFAVLFRERRLALAITALLPLGMWLLEAVETLVILRLLQVTLGFREVLALEVVVVMLRSLAFMVPGALGVLDAGYVAFLAAFGVPDAPTVGVAFMLIKRAKEVLWVAVGFLLFLVMKDAPRAPELGLGASP